MEKLNSILYVEDEQSAQQILSRFLKRFCENLYVANNGQEALEIYGKHNFDLVISDIKMPILNGIEFISKVKELNEEQHVIFTTAYNDEIYLQEAIKLQVSAYILKPIDLDILEKKLDDIIISTLWKKIEEEKHKEFETILETTNDGIAIMDLETNFLYVNNAFEKLLGYSKIELYDTSSINISKEKDKEKTLENVKYVLENNYSEDFQKIFISKTGNDVEVSINASLMPDKQRLLVAVRDITEKKEKERLLDNYNSIIDQNVLISTTNLKGKIISASKAFCELSGYEETELLCKSHNIIRHPDTSKEIFINMWETIKSNKTWKGEIKNKKKNGDFYWVKTIITPIYDAKENKIGYTATRHDITDKKYIEEISRIDPLTEIYNRRFFDEKFTPAMNSAKRDNKIFSFLMMDIDHFKQYNDTYGHQMGDDVLKKVAKKLKTSLHRADDYCFRLGGEEFAITFKSENIEQAKEFSETIRTNIENLKIIHKNNSASEYVTVSIGLLMIQPSTNTNLNEVYKITDELLYKAKENGRNQIMSKLL